MTEVRCLFLGLNVALYVPPPVPFDIAAMNLGYGGALGLAWLAANPGLYAAGMIAQLGQLARESQARKDR